MEQSSARYIIDSTSVNLFKRRLERLHASTWPRPMYLAPEITTPPDKNSVFALFWRFMIKLLRYIELLGLMNYRESGMDFPTTSK